MKIEKREYIKRFYYYYLDNSSKIKILHGLYNDLSLWGIGYYYHGTVKGFWLENNYEN